MNVLEELTQSWLIGSAALILVACLYLITLSVAIVYGAEDPVGLSFLITMFEIFIPIIVGMIIQSMRDG